MMTKPKSKREFAALYGIEVTAADLALSNCLLVQPELPSWAVGYRLYVNGVDMGFVAREPTDGA